jgi:hypothetical protein
LDRKAELRPAVIVGAIFEMAALFRMGRSDPVQGDWPPA